jgi:hypothetical protein
MLLEDDTFLTSSTRESLAEASLVVSRFTGILLSNYALLIAIKILDGGLSEYL